MLVRLGYKRVDIEVEFVCVMLGIDGDVPQFSI
jgi:hypothetical protein